ncbi:MAG: 16S rRNA (cytidine(1402)-2'-O)-methyltransferase [Rhodobacteraceae bacterium]|nr:16S rRNA (cytidine(1402)-2'-O)-methyltransferase [Paracoccaceae bacterium]
MNHQIVKLSPGLYLVATPIGAARDITLRALDILASVDILAAEDTRRLRKLAEIHAIPLAGRPVIAYHDHSGPGERARLLSALAKGNSVAYASEAGTPMIADPGFDLARAVRDAGYTVTAAPGPSAVVTALTLGGLPTDAFHFAGFLPNTRVGRRTRMETLTGVAATLVFYESPNRIAAALEDAVSVFGADHPAALCRELTKKFEDVRRGSLAAILNTVNTRPPKGEIVLLIDRARSEPVNKDYIEDNLRIALDRMSVRDAADLVSKAHGLPRRQVYQMALKLGKTEI